MNILNNLHNRAHKNQKRLGRGPASGQGKTAGKGTKGQRSRTGSKRRVWSEGGQTPLIHRIPKRGFNNPGKTEYTIIHLGRLEQFEPNTVIDPTLLKEKGLIKGRLPIKILSGGELTKPLTVRVHKFSTKAKEKIEAAQGKAEPITDDRSQKSEDRSNKSQ